MAETEGFTFPDRCFACRDIHRCLSGYESLEDTAKKALAVVRSDVIALLDTDIDPTNFKGSLSSSAEDIIKAYEETTHVRIDFARRLTQAVFDQAEMICLGMTKEPEEEFDGGVSLKNCEYPGGLPVPKYAR